jgi:phage gpG-like protein
MAETRNIREIVKYVRGLQTMRQKAYTVALIETATLARGEAIKIARTQFIGRNGRKLSSQLLDRIFSSIDTDPGKEYPTAYVGTYGIPYGRIHEYGGTIRPKKAKFLWIKQWEGVPGFLRRITPKEFFINMKKMPHVYGIIDQVAFYFGTKRKVKLRKGETFGQAHKRLGEFISLFILRKSVKMPERPYLRPAVKISVRGFSALATKRFAELVSKV